MKTLALYTHTHTHTCISLKEEKSVNSISVKSIALKIIVSRIALISAQILNNIYIVILATIYVLTKNNLIFKVDRLLFSKQNDLLPKSDFLLFEKIQNIIKNFFKKVNIRNSIFEEIAISRLNQLVC